MSSNARLKCFGRCRSGNDKLIMPVCRKQNCLGSCRSGKDKLNFCASKRPRTRASKNWSD